MCPWSNGASSFVSGPTWIGCQCASLANAVTKCLTLKRQVFWFQLTAWFRFRAEEMKISRLKWSKFRISTGACWSSTRCKWCPLRCSAKSSVWLKVIASWVSLPLWSEKMTRFESLTSWSGPNCTKRTGRICRTRATWRRFSALKSGVKWHLTFFLNTGAPKKVKKRLCTFVTLTSLLQQSTWSIYMSKEVTKLSFFLMKFSPLYGSLSTWNDPLSKEEWMSLRKWIFLRTSRNMMTSTPFSSRKLVTPRLIFQQPT